MAFLRLINGGDPNYLLTGVILQVMVFQILSPRDKSQISVIYHLLLAILPDALRSCFFSTDFWGRGKRAKKRRGRKETWQNVWLVREVSFMLRVREVPCSKATKKNIVFSNTDRVSSLDEYPEIWKKRKRRCFGHWEESWMPSNYLGKWEYFTNLDFPEIRGFPLLIHHLGKIGRVRSL